MNNLSCIAFYDSLEEQDFRKWYAYGEKYPLMADKDSLLPFFFSVPKIGTQTTIIAHFYKMCCDDREVTGRGSFNFSFSEAFDVTQKKDTFNQKLLRSLVAHDVNDRTYYVFKGENIGLNLPYGYYYLVFEIGSHDMYKVLYSEVFRVGEVSNMLKVEWGDNEELISGNNVVPYEIGAELFRNRLYLDATIGKPEYSVTEEGEERDGYFFAIKQISEKTYKFNFVAPEYLLDVMRLIRLSDEVTITDKNKVYHCDTFAMDSAWLEQGHYASVECSFQTDTVVKKIGKAY